MFFSFLDTRRKGRGVYPYLQERMTNAIILFDLIHSHKHIQINPHTFCIYRMTKLIVSSDASIECYGYVSVTCIWENTRTLYICI